jgi:hypothetical protein
MLRRLSVAELAGQMTQVNINEVMTGFRQLNVEKVRNACPRRMAQGATGHRPSTRHTRGQTDTTSLSACVCVCVFVPLRNSLLA